MITLFALVSCTKTKLDCGDLLAQYAQKPEALEFVDCKSGTGQILYTAIYRVPETNAEAVERILVDDYGMGKADHHVRPCRRQRKGIDNQQEQNTLLLCAGEYCRNLKR